MRVFLLAAVLAGCAPEDETAIGQLDAGLSTCAELEVGTGAVSFVPVTDGDTVALYRGPQGGYMLYLGVRARGIDPTDATLCYTETFTSGYETGKVFGEGCWRIKMPNQLDDGWSERVGVWGETKDEYWASSYRIRGQDARVDVTIADRSGCKASAGWTVHIDEHLGL